MKIKANKKGPVAEQKNISPKSKPIKKNNNVGKQGAKIVPKLKQENSPKVKQENPPKPAQPGQNANKNQNKQNKQSQKKQQNNKKRKAEADDPSSPKKAKTDPPPKKISTKSADTISNDVKQYVAMLKNDNAQVEPMKAQLADKTTENGRRTLKKKIAFLETLISIKSKQPTPKTTAFLKNNLEKIISIEGRAEKTARSVKYLVKFRALHELAVEAGLQKPIDKSTIVAQAANQNVNVKKEKQIVVKKEKQNAVVKEKQNAVKKALPKKLVPVKKEEEEESSDEEDEEIDTTQEPESGEDEEDDDDEEDSDGENGEAVAQEDDDDSDESDDDEEVDEADSDDDDESEEDIATAVIAMRDQKNNGKGPIKKATPFGGPKGNKKKQK